MPTEPARLSAGSGSGSAPRLGSAEIPVTARAANGNGDSYCGYCGFLKRHSLGFKTTLNPPGIPGIVPGHPRAN